MYQMIHEPISVIGVYNQGKFCLKKFKWREQTYNVDQTTLIANLQDGGVKQRMYSVQSGVNVYRILFNRETEIWQLAEIWLDG